MKILGLSTGILRDILNFEEIIFFYKEIGCEAIELSPDHWRYATKALLSSFKYISVHTGASFLYTNNKETYNEFKLLEEKHNEVGFKCVVLHPTSVKNWNVFNNYKLPWAIENMDNTNTIGIMSEEILRLIKGNNLNVVLDLNHCFTHDRTMQLADKFYEILDKRIVELHISGYENQTDQGRHLPLSVTKQLEIIKKAKNPLPTIIEMDSGTRDSVKKEFEYLKKALKFF
jgi:sugar phosphate isomerase/epimerase